MNHLEHLINEKKVFFNYMNENFTIFQHSNLFFRDLQYAILSYFEMKEQSIKYAAAEKIAKDFIENMLQTNELTEIDYKSWKVNFEIGTNKKQVEMEEVEND